MKFGIVLDCLVGIIIAINALTLIFGFHKVEGATLVENMILGWVMLTFAYGANLSAKLGEIVEILEKKNDI